MHSYQTTLVFHIPSCLRRWRHATCRNEVLVCAEANRNLKATKLAETILAAYGNYLQLQRWTTGNWWTTLGEEQWATYTEIAFQLTYQCSMPSNELLSQLTLLSLLNLPNLAGLGESKIHIIGHPTRKVKRPVAVCVAYLVMPPMGNIL